LVSGLEASLCIRSVLPRNLEPFGQAGLLERGDDRQLVAPPQYEHLAMFIRYPFSSMLVDYVVKVRDLQPERNRIMAMVISCSV